MGGLCRVFLGRRLAAKDLRVAARLGGKSAPSCAHSKRFARFVARHIFELNSTTPGLRMSCMRPASRQFRYSWAESGRGCEKGSRRQFLQTAAVLMAGTAVSGCKTSEVAQKGITDIHHKLLYGSDCDDLAGFGSDCQGAQTIATLQRLLPNRSIQHKLFHYNATRLLKI